jgi:hypothetical protein
MLGDAGQDLAVSLQINSQLEQFISPLNSLSRDDLAHAQIDFRKIIDGDLSGTGFSAKVFADDTAAELSPFNSLPFSGNWAS